MAKSKAEWRKTTIKVRGNRAFPVDMLRYDNCCPATEADSSLIEYSLEGGAREGPAYIITLDHYTFDGGKATAECWKSFGWEVVEDFCDVR